MHPSIRRALSVGAAMVVLAACAPSLPAETAASSATPGAGEAAQFPLTVTSCGRQVTIPSRPQRIVAMEGAAETLFALGAGDQVAGYFGAAPESLPENLAAQARATTRRGGSFPFPTAERVLAGGPDLVVLYGFGDSGALAQQLEAQQVPYLQLSETCPTPDHTVAGYLRDVVTIATAIGRRSAGERLVEQWRGELPTRTSPAPGAPRIVVQGNQDPTKPFVSGAGSFVHDQIAYAGGVNAYADEPKAYLSPSWEDIASRRPDIIFSGGGGGEKVRQALQDYLAANAALAQMPAVSKGRVITLDYAKNVPGPQAIEGIKEIHRAVAQAGAGS